MSASRLNHWDSNRRPSRRRWRVVAAGVAIAVSTACAATVDPWPPAASAQPFAPGSPFDTPISANAQVDPNSESMISGVADGGRLAANLVEFGIPIFSADANTPRYTVPCTIKDWGPCPFDGRQVPIPDNARPHSGSDEAMVVVDQSTGSSYEFWGARKEGGGWTVRFAAVTSLGGSGWGGGGTGSGASRLAGVIRVAEIAQGSIPHALALATNNACAGIVRPPATKTDGRSNRSNCIPEGARLQLDPAIDLGTLDLKPGERTVATAMQRYGGYVVDVSGSPLNAAFELDPQASRGSVGPVYQEAGFRGDYDGMARVPWDRLRVVQ